MSSLLILGDTSGSVLLQAPAVAGSGTLTLPTGTGTLNIPQADQWRITSALQVTGGTNPTLASNWERSDNSGYGLLGAGMTQSSGVFTFPSTGIWQIFFYGRVFFNGGGGAQYAYLSLNTTVDNSNYVNVADPICSAATTDYYQSVFGTWLFNVTNTSLCKVKLLGGGTNTFNFMGSTDINLTGITFVRIGG
jgi:hypothetical protein